MTVFYSTEGKFGQFFALFFKWKGSIFKLVWHDLLIFLLLYFALSVLYRFGLDDDGKIIFVKLSFYCEKYGTLIPVSFVLGFYVSLVIGRWWAQYNAIPWIDTVAIWVNASIKGDDDDTRMLRRTICRYVCLAITQNFILISSPVKKRFPTTDHLIAAGLLLPNERIEIDNISHGITKGQTHWIPLVWATTVVTQARQDGKIVADIFMKTIIDEINKIKDSCNLLLCFDRVRIPLVYTQVVTLAVYVYFLSCLMGKQWVNKHKFHERAGKYEENELDLIVPVFTILQFLFYIGWLKVAEHLVNPFGDDDYDFELNWMVDRHLQVSYSIVDKMQLRHPEVKKDAHWEEVVPHELPHTISSWKCHNDPPVPSTSAIVVFSDDDKKSLKRSFRIREKDMAEEHAELVNETLGEEGVVLKSIENYSRNSTRSQKLP